MHTNHFIILPPSEESLNVEEWTPQQKVTLIFHFRKPSSIPPLLSHFEERVGEERWRLAAKVLCERVGLGRDVLGREAAVGMVREFRAGRVD